MELHPDPDEVGADTGARGGAFDERCIAGRAVGAAAATVMELAAGVDARAVGGSAPDVLADAVAFGDVGGGAPV